MAEKSSLMTGRVGLARSLLKWSSEQYSCTQGGQVDDGHPLLGRGDRLLRRGNRLCRRLWEAIDNGSRILARRRRLGRNPRLPLLRAAQSRAVL